MRRHYEPQRLRDHKGVMDVRDTALRETLLIIAQRLCAEHGTFTLAEVEASYFEHLPEHFTSRMFTTIHMRAFKALLQEGSIVALPIKQKLFGHTLTTPRYTMAGSAQDPAASAANLPAE